MANIYEYIKYFKTDDDVEIEYADLGGTGPTLLFIPGYSLATDLVLPALSKLKDDFRVVTLTLRGFGGAKPDKARGSEQKGEISIAQAARDVKELISLLNLEDCILIGYSMGTHVAFSYIEQFGCDNIAKLVILDMTPKLINDESWNLGLYQGHYTKERYIKDIEAMENDYNIDFNRYFFHQAAISHTRDEIRDYKFTSEMLEDIEEYAKWYNIPGLTAELLMHVPIQKWSLYQTYWKDMSNQDFRHMLGRITVPTGILYAQPGSIYDVKTAEYLKTQIPNSKIYPLEGATHTTIITSKLSEFIRQVNNFSNEM